MRSKTCPKCQSSMAEGYIAHERSGLPAVSTWSEGAPSKAWYGIKKAKRQIEISVWRCQRCGFLEQFAVD